MKKASALREVYELLSSMRFAISLLTVLAIASVVGTVIKQNEPFNSYLNQFGPFWFPVFETLGLYNVYGAGWFLAILAFLVLSTATCIVRQARPMSREMRAFKEHAREASLRLFRHHHAFEGAGDETARDAVRRNLLASGFRWRENIRDEGILFAARKGSWTRAGYFLAHGGLVVICLGGLLDGNLPLKLQLAFGDKAATRPDQLIADIPDRSRLSESNWSYRANLFVPEGRSSDMAIVQAGDGILLQPLPFHVSLDKFHVEHYPGGQPKRFASDIMLTDKRTGASVSRTIEVNKPFEYAGVTLYQASFEDGGSRLQLRTHPLGGGESTRFDGVVGERGTLEGTGYRYTVEFTGFRAFNIEDMGDGRAASVGLQDRLGSAAGKPDQKDLRNVGPSVQYKLRDSAGQAREYSTYMLPIEQDGRWLLLAGMRENPNEGFRFLRIPVDTEGRLDTWFALRAAFADPATHAILARRFAHAATQGAQLSADSAAKLEETTLRTIQLFAARGFESLGAFIERSIPEGERDRAGEIFIQVLEGVTWQAVQLQRERAGQPALVADDSTGRFLRDSLNAVSDSFHYGAPVLLTLEGFEQVQATVLQATRSPGKAWVYLGSTLLVLGIFAMLYVHERRLFVLLRHDGRHVVALSANRSTMDVERDFAHHRDQLAQALRAAPADPAAAPPSGDAT